MKTLCSKAFSIFLMATKLAFSSSIVVSFAATTTPYAPEPTGSMTSYLIGSSKREPRTFQARVPAAVFASPICWTYLLPSLAAFDA